MIEKSQLCDAETDFDEAFRMLEIAKLMGGQRGLDAHGWRQDASVENAHE